MIVPEAYSRSEVIEACRQDFNVFAALALGEGVFSEPFPDEYLMSFELIKDAAQLKDRSDHKFVFGFPRGHGKTTVAKLIAAWLFVFTDKQYILVACSSEPKAESFIGDVFRILTSPNIMALFGNPEADAEKKSQGLKVFKYRGFTRILHAVGANGDPRGVNINFRRPDVQICDDIQSRENAKSEAESKSLYEWYSSTFLYTKSPEGLLHVFIGNTFPYAGSILTKLRNNPDYISFVVGAILADGSAFWEAVHPKKKLLADLQSAINLGQQEVFFSELMNDAKSVTAIGFDYSRLPDWDQPDYSLPAHGFIIIDPAGKQKHSDDTAIGACYIYDSLEKPYFRSVVSEQMSPGETIFNALALAYELNIRTIFVEAVAYQRSLLYWFNFICEREGIHGFQFLPIHPRPAAKNVRIADSLRQIQGGEILLHPDVKAQVLNQIQQFDPTKTDNKDDILDLVDYMFEIPLKHAEEISLVLIDLSSAEGFVKALPPPWLNSPV